MTLTALTAEHEKQLQAWRADALEKMPYFSNIMFTVRPLNAPGLGTWAVDQYYRLYIDFDAVADKSFKWNSESVLHESSHLFAEHHEVRVDLGISPTDGAALKVLNAANDFSINDDLDAAGCTTFRDDKMLPEFIGEENGHTPHHYYGVLAKKIAEAQKNNPQPKCGSCGQGKPQSGQQPQPPSQGQQGGQPQQPNGAPQPQQGQGQQGGGNGGQCPQPGGQNGQSGDDGSGGAPGGQGQQPGQQSGQGAPQPGANGQPGSTPAGQGACSECGQDKGPFKGCGSGSGGEAWAGELGPNDDFGGLAPAVGEVEKEAIRLATAAAIKDYVAKGRGTVPAGLVEIADKVLEPTKTPWQTLLSAAVKKAVSRKAGSQQIDHNRRNRRRHNETIMTPTGPRRVIVPGYFKPVPRLVLIRDTSGSMGAYDLAMANREVEGIAKKIGIRGDDLLVMDVDAAVHAVKKFKGRDTLREVTGRGGTSMTVGIQAVWDSKDKPNAIVVLTDGGTDWPTEPGPVPVVAAIVPQGNGQYADMWEARVPEFIKTIVVEPAQPVTA